MTIIPKRESLRTRARKKARNIGVSDRRRRAAAPQSLFGALLEYLSQSPRANGGGILLDWEPRP